MKESLLLLDPRADALLILQKPNLHLLRAPIDEVVSVIRTADEANSPIPLEIQQGDTTEPPKTNDDLRSLQPYQENGDPNQIVFRVSAKHLCLASPVFRKAFQGNFKESKQNEQGLLEITTSEWNAETLLILLDIIHGHHYCVPKQPGLAIIAQIGTIVDYYDCLEAVKIVFSYWHASIGNGKTYRSLPSPEDDIMHKGLFGDGETTILFMAWMAQDQECFKGLTRSAVLTTNGLVETHLPMPAQILEKINNKRCEIIDQMISQMYSLIDDLIEGRVGCSEECSCRLLGFLMKQMNQQSLPTEKPERPFWGYSVVYIRRIIGRVQTRRCNTSGCTLQARLGLYQKKNELGTAVPGLDLEDFQ
ncbi:unnamed protein product [Fusarium fujikuroi]|uniref:BTB domain-containing protein n=1 Tax=Fusarium fujikuroi TaxID=5127 RepID=A0A9Q9UBK0_FUSFU|nr:uncharacterized protein FFE2_06380 [Fusarium fujikuroi]SCO31096.1 uncharacterized protein FFNC_01788 [Fusarium fujikuroi]VTT72186.1 unnamed protein product [Fusarium fujikuroi]VTT81142.1 unnamed protein product [Fusarium fujikuroi]